jgi:predicted dehydrogenase
MNKLHIGIIGMGVISHYYIKGFDAVPQCALRAVCDLDDSKLAVHRDAGRSCYRDYQDMLRDPDVQAVVINLPNHLHHPVCLAALHAGKHVCCEKPLTLDPGEALDLSRVARERSLTLLTAFHRRYNRPLTSAVAAGVFDRPRAVVAHYDERIEEHAGSDAWYLDPQACGGGCIADNGPNVFDALTLALGPLNLRQARARYDTAGVDRGAEIDLCTTDGRPVRALLSWDYPHGERKDLTVHHADGSSTCVDMLAGSAGFKTSLYHEYEGVLRHLHDAVYRHPEHGEGGVEAVRLVAECYARLESGKVPA